MKAGDGPLARRAGEGRRFHGNKRLSKHPRHLSSAFGAFSPEGKKRNSSAAPFLRAMYQTRVGFMRKDRIEKVKAPLLSGN
jgi:hypothetical protein